MTLSINQDVKLTFNLLALRKESEVLLTGRQWENRNAFVDRCEDARQKERDLFDERYEVRIKNEVKRLNDEAGSKTKDYKPNWAQDDLFDSTATLAQADTNVRTAHDNRITGIDQIEERGISERMQTARSENNVHNKLKNGFNKSADRRFSDRRMTPSRNQQQ